MAQSKAIFRRIRGKVVRFTPKKMTGSVGVSSKKPKHGMGLIRLTPKEFQNFVKKNGGIKTPKGYLFK